MCVWNTMHALLQHDDRPMISFVRFGVTQATRAGMLGLPSGQGPVRASS